MWIESHEHEDALREIAALCRKQNWRLASWNVEQGLRLPGTDQPADQPADPGGADPLAAIRSLGALASPELFVVVEHELPGREQLEEIARGIVGRLSSPRTFRTGPQDREAVFR